MIGRPGQQAFEHIVSNNLISNLPINISYFSNKVIHLAIQAGVSTILASFGHTSHSRTGNKLGPRVVKRERKCVDEIFRKLGPIMTRRAY